VPERLSIKKTHQYTSTAEMPVKIPNKPTSTVGLDVLRIEINLSSFFLHRQRVAPKPCGARQNAAVEIMQTMRRSKTRSEAARKRRTPY